MTAQSTLPAALPVGSQPVFPPELPAPEPAQGGHAELLSKFPVTLLRNGLIRPEQLVTAMTLGHRRNIGNIPDRLLPRGGLSEETLLDAASRHFGASRVDPCAPMPDPGLLDRFGVQEAFRLSMVPWRRAGAATVVVTAKPEEFAHHRPGIESRLGPVVMALAPIARIEEAILAVRGPRLALAAEARVPERESCRNWGSHETVLWALVIACMMAACVLAVPILLGQVLLAMALLCLLLGSALKLMAVLAALRTRHPVPPATGSVRLPVVSVIVALYRESDIAARLVRRLSRLDYPRELLDVVLAVEAEDAVTRAALVRANLPAWMRVVVVPAGRVKTKPRALNLALDHCRGSIVGIYDAEDAPEPGQIRKVVDSFNRHGPEVACLQGMLDYYNPSTNWLSRCFTLEYATWFRLILPGVARLGLVVPLGGTTLFFRRAALEELGGWDAHNVTEDADLGVRLVRHGYRTEILETVTGEEANCRMIPWIKQRSRWIKGYMMTWTVHMRDPRLLWRQLGTRRFAAFQVMFLGTILQFLLAPLLWSFWAVPLGLPHPLAATLSPTVFQFMIAAFLLTAAVDLSASLVALRRSGHRMSPFWVFTLHFYFPLATLAAYKALWEVVVRPFYWDKTRHGIYDSASPS